MCARECFVYMHRLKWCMCTVLWLQFTPSYYHHEPSTFNYIRYCLKWIFPSIRLFPSTSLTHTLILILFTLPIIMLQKKKEKNTSRCNVCIVVNATNHHCNECICDDFIWYIGCSCYILLWIRIFFLLYALFFCWWSLIFSFCFGWSSFCTSLWFCFCYFCCQQHTNVSMESERTSEQNKFKKNGIEIKTIKTIQVLHQFDRVIFMNMYTLHEYVILYIFDGITFTKMPSHIAYMHIHYTTTV